MIAYVVAGLVFLGSISTFWAYQEGKSTGAEEANAQHTENVLSAIEIRDEVLAAVATGLSDVKIENKTYVRNFRTLEKENVVYKECTHPDAAMRMLNSALRGDKVPSEPAVPGKLPGEPGGAK